MDRGLWRVAALTAAASMIAAAAHGRALRREELNPLVLVPYPQRNPGLPHPGDEGALVTLKGMIRFADRVAGYQVAWDVNQNGDYDDDWSFTAQRDARSIKVEDIGRTIELPDVERDRQHHINVRVRSRCSNADRPRECLIIQTCNECLVPRFPDRNEERAYPDECLDVIEEQR